MRLVVENRVSSKSGNPYDVLVIYVPGLREGEEYQMLHFFRNSLEKDLVLKALKQDRVKEVR